MNGTADLTPINLETLLMPTLWLVVTLPQAE